MATGDTNNLLNRVLGLIPGRWFAWAAAGRNAVLGGLTDLSAWCYDWIGYARLQTRLATATDVWLDVLCYDFLGRNLLRNGSIDDTFRALIRATILQERVTRKGMFQVVKALTGNDPWIFEPWNTWDTGAYKGASGRVYGSFGYGVGRGGYGNMNLPAQVFMKVIRGASSGVANVDGYSGYAGGYGVGSIEYAGSFIRLVGVTDEQIEQMITFTRPTGVTVWLNIS
jgi:hypothetical protein